MERQFPVIPIRTLGIDDATELELRTDGNSLIFTPITPEERREKIRRVGEDIAVKHARALQAMVGEEKPHEAAS